MNLIRRTQQNKIRYQTFTASTFETKFELALIIYLFLHSNLQDSKTVVRFFFLKLFNTFELRNRIFSLSKLTKTSALTYQNSIAASQNIIFHECSIFLFLEQQCFIQDKIKALFLSMILGQARLLENTVMHIVGNLIIEPIEMHQKSHRTTPQQSPTNHHIHQHLNRSEQFGLRRSREGKRDDFRGSSPPRENSLSPQYSQMPFEKYQVKVDIEARSKQQKKQQWQDVQSQKEEISSIKQRVENLENMLKANIDRVSQAGEAIKEMNLHLIQKVKEQDETLNQRIDVLANFNENWRNDNQKEIREQIEIMKEEINQKAQEIRRQQLEFQKEVRTERYNSEEIIQRMILEVMDKEKQNSQTLERMETYLENHLSSKIKDEIKRVQIEFKREFEILQKRVYLSFKELEGVPQISWELDGKEKQNEDNRPLIEATRIFLFGKEESKEEQKVESSFRQSIQEKIKGEFKPKLVEKMIKSRSDNLFDWTTPFVKNFKVEGNVITLIKEEWKDDKKIYNQQVLLDVIVKGIFMFKMHIRKSKKSAIMVGVVDRLTQKEKMDSFTSGNAICYSGFKGRINYGEGGEWKFKENGDCLCEGMEVKVKVDMEAGTVTFTLKYPSKLVKTHSISSDILTQPNRQFVPFFQMTHGGDTIEWQIQ